MCKGLATALHRKQGGFFRLKKQIKMKYKVRHIRSTDVNIISFLLRRIEEKIYGQINKDIIEIIEGEVRTNHIHMFVYHHK